MLTQKWLRILLPVVVAVLIAAALVLRTAQHASALNSFTVNLDNNSTNWNPFIDKAKGCISPCSLTDTIMNVSTPSLDGDALEGAIDSGSGFTNLLVFDNLPPDDAAQTFEMNMYFNYGNSASVVQALEFTEDQWVNNTRFEWAMHWDNGESTTGTWRLWTGAGGWSALPLTQALAVNTWHFLHLYGEVLNGKAQYLGFACDGVVFNFSPSTDYSFAPVASSGDKLSVGFQLDGDQHDDAYHEYVDQVAFLWT